MAVRRLMVLTAVLMWVWAGLGHNVVMSACYESRHSIGQEPEVFGGVVGVVFDVIFWPLATLGNVADPPDCRPKPLIVSRS